MLKLQHMLEKGSGSMQKGGIQKYISLMRNLNSPPLHQKCRLHRAPRGCAEDEGGPLGVGLQEQASNHLKLLWSKAMVVSV